VELQLSICHLPIQRFSKPTDLFADAVVLLEQSVSFTIVDVFI